MGGGARWVEAGGGGSGGVGAGGWRTGGVGTGGVRTGGVMFGGVVSGSATGGHSPNFWGRAMGWYGMALVDALDYFPAGHPGRDTLLGILQRYAAPVRDVHDPATGLW